MRPRALALLCGLACGASPGARTETGAASGRTSEAAATSDTSGDDGSSSSSTTGELDLPPDPDLPDPDLPPAACRVGPCGCFDPPELLGEPGGRTMVADFDDDGVLDLAVAVGYSTRLELHLGAGDGSFDLVAEGALNAALRAPVAGDFDGDGLVDLALAAGYALEPHGEEDRLSFASNAHLLAGLAPAVAVDLPFGQSLYGGADRLAAGELDGDGADELVVVHRSGNFVTLWDVEGESFATPPAILGTDIDPEVALVADVDGDGLDDLVVANEGSDTLSVYAGEGDGSLAPQVRYPLPAHIRTLAVVDVAADPRVVVGGFGEVWEVALAGGVASIETVVKGSPWASELDVGDLSGDGRDDLILEISDGLLVVCRGDDGAEGPFLIEVVRPWTVGRIVTGEFTGDGLVDMIVSAHGGRFLYRSRP